MIGICDLSSLNAYPIKTFRAFQINTFCNEFNSIKKDCCKILLFKKINNAPNYVDTNPNPKNYSKIIIFSSMANFFGGTENLTIINKYKFLAKFKGDIYYLFNDFCLPIKEIYNDVLHRPWNKYKKSDLKIASSKRSINIISSFKNLDKVKQINKFVNIENIKYIDFNTWEIENNHKYLKNLAKYDLVYGINNKKKRFNRIDKYLGDLPKDISLYIYGNLKIDSLKKSYNSLTKKPKINPDKVLDNNALGFATIIIGEKYYDNNQIPERLYESILANCICFIDNEFDEHHKIFKNDYFYVNSKDELVKKIRELKTNKVLYNKLISEQHRFLNKKSKEDNVKKVYNYVIKGI